MQWRELVSRLMFDIHDLAASFGLAWLSFRIWLSLGIMLIRNTFSFDVHCMTLNLTTILATSQLKSNPSAYSRVTERKDISMTGIQRILWPNEHLIGTVHSCKRSVQSPAWFTSTYHRFAWQWDAMLRKTAHSYGRFSIPRKNWHPLTDLIKICHDFASARSPNLTFSVSIPPLGALDTYVKYKVFPFYCF